MQDMDPRTRGNGRFYYAIEPLEKFKEMVQSIRIEKGFSLKQTADYLKVSLPTLNRVLNGSSVSTSTRQRLEPKLSAAGIKFVVR